MLSNRSDLAEIQSALEEWLKGRIPGAEDLSLVNLRKAERGFSTDTLLFEVRWKEGGKARSQGMVLRRKPELPLFPDYDLRRQIRVMQCLEKTPIPVPKVLWFEPNAAVLNDPFYIMSEIKGVTPSDYPVYHSHGCYLEATPAQRAKMWWGCIEAMARIHKLDWQAAGLRFLAAPRYGASVLDQALNYLEHCLQWAREGQPQPILERGLRWLKDHRYDPEHVTLCWGDSRMSNIIYDAHTFEVAAVLDWEVAHLGDPEADLAWTIFQDWSASEFCGVPRLEGTPGTDETIRRCEELTGWKLKHLHYNKVLVGLVLGVPMLTIYKRMKKAGVPIGDVELNNLCTHWIAENLDLPLPGPRPTPPPKADECTVTVQLDITGPGGSERYIIIDRGQATVHKGWAPNPNVTITASAADWEAILRGELDRTQSFMSGKIKAEGDIGVLIQFGEKIFEQSRQAP